MIEVFELPHGWAYRVEGVYQEYDPDLEGFVPMSEARANECAEAVRERLLNGE